ncbi:MAG: histidinol-phosphate transaminase [Parolsenella sp.]|uniref:histidinol-phosphate transaminase n=1 Tax=Parolsenella sp. TaxID=2083006 RepID=UPI002E7600B6|nr:histidinol-phosphate transaminase [Parolsenella sp.]MEE1372221.1 histidinol-phosphate transaminase [Parolsenella sp.]
MAQLSDRIKVLVQPHLRTLEPYDPNFTPTRVNLSANENTYDVPAPARALVDEAFATTPTNRYPDPMSNDLRDELAAWHGVSRENVIVGNGGDELLYNFLLAFGGPGRTLVNVPPTFSEYAFFASLTQTGVRDVWRDPETFLPRADELVAAAGEASLVILTSPNNPTGDVAALELVARVCDACPGLVMVDEAYGEFAEPGTSAEALLAEHDNLLVLHTLSKAFALAGARCGYVIAAPDVIAALAAVRQIYSVNVLTQAAALAAVRARAEFDPTVEKIVSERSRLYESLARVEGVRVWPSEGNFILARMAGASRVRERLRDERSILVRDFSYAPGLADCLRITVGTPEENDAVIEALSEIVSEEAARAAAAGKEPACATNKEDQDD